MPQITPGSAFILSSVHHSSFIVPHSSFLFSEPLMDQFESLIADFIIKVLHKSAPALTPADDAKITKTVADFVTAGMDLVAIYFAIRNAKK